MVQKFLDQQKGFLDQQGKADLGKGGKGDLGLLYMDDDEDYDEEDYKWWRGGGKHKENLMKWGLSELEW